MATRLKTVEYAFDSSRAVLAATTFLTFGAITLTIPETSGRVFKNVYLDVTAWDADTTATVLNAAPTVGVQLAAVAFSDTTFPVDTTLATAFGVNQFNMRLQLDVTSYFVSNFGSGTTQTLGVRVKFPNTPTSNISVKVVVTYEYDDTNTTRAKTVRIPLEGYSGSLPTSLTQIGSSTEIPNLSTFLPEASVTVQNVWFEISSMQMDGGATWALTMALDAEAGVADSNHLRTLSTINDKTEYFLIWVRNDMTTNATHLLKLKGTNANNFLNPVVIMHVTYTYDHSGSSTILNSLMIPLRAFQAPTASTSADAHTFYSKFFVEEGSPTLVQSAVVVKVGIDEATDSLGGAWTDTPSLIVGSQTARTYYNPFQASGGCRGQVDYSQRIDSGGTKGAGMTLARGENSITAKFYGSADMPTKVVSAVAYVNYTSTKANAGDGIHNHTIRWLYWGTKCQSNVNSPNYVSKFTPAVLYTSETNYWITAIGTEVITGGGNGGVRTPWGAVAIQTGEFGGFGWFTLQPELFEAFDRAFLVYADISYAHKRSNADPDTNRLNLKTSRNGRVVSPWAGGCYSSCVVDYTYHSFAYSVQGVVTGYTGTGGSLTVDLHRADTGEKMATTTTAVGGAYSFSWFDNTINVYTESYQDSTHLGRSLSSTATGSP